MNVERFHMALGQAVALRRTETVIQFALFMEEIGRLERECYAARLLHAETFRPGDFMIARDLLVDWECAPFRDGDVVKAGEEFFTLRAPKVHAPKFKLVDPRRGLYRQMTSREAGKESGERWKFKKTKGSKPKKAKRCQAKRQKRNRSRTNKRSS